MANGVPSNVGHERPRRKGNVTVTFGQRVLPTNYGMTYPISYKRHRFPPQLIAHAVWLYFRFPLSLRVAEEMLLERGIEVSYETIQRWGKKFGPAYARRLRRKSVFPLLLRQTVFANVTCLGRYPKSIEQPECRPGGSARGRGSSRSVARRGPAKLTSTQSAKFSKNMACTSTGCTTRRAYRNRASRELPFIVKVSGNMFYVKTALYSGVEAPLLSMAR